MVVIRGRPRNLSNVLTVDGLVLFGHLFSHGLRGYAQVGRKTKPCADSKLESLEFVAGLF
jgi:hypothetical protein